MSRSKIFLLLLLLFAPLVSHGAITLPWDSTLSGSTEWTTASGSPTGYDGIDYLANIAATGGHRTQITSGANYTSGVGGMGLRNWLNSGSTSLGVSVAFETGQTELWMRFYIRGQSGLSLNSYFKLIYLKNEIGSNSTCFDIGTYGMSGSAVTATPVGAGSYTTWDAGSESVSKWLCNNNSTFDGSWHYVEFHVKAETVSTAPYDGVVEVYVDGTRIINVTNANHGIFSGSHTWNSLVINTNTASTAISSDYYYDMDDFVINNTGYIGPLGGTPAPAPPTLSNVTISGGSFR